MSDTDIVATPIGNLDEITLRAAETFAKADFIAAEDTRVTLKLLNHLGLKKPMVSYYEHNLKERAVRIRTRIEAGESCALCSGRGYARRFRPRRCHRAGRTRPGHSSWCPCSRASAAVTALCRFRAADGSVCVRRFSAYQPPSEKGAAGRTKKRVQRTVIFYEAPHKLPTTLTRLGSRRFRPERSL
ncbi:MAG: SAM-dependent methyltransferase [Ruthenibacterium lactatiformans]